MVRVAIIEAPARRGTLAACRLDRSIVRRADKWMRAGRDRRDARACSRIDRCELTRDPMREMTCRVNAPVIVRECDWWDSRGIRESECRETVREIEKKRKRAGASRSNVKFAAELRAGDHVTCVAARKGIASSRRVMVRVFSLGGQNEGDDVAARSSVSPVDRCADLAVVELGSWTCKFASSPQACTPLAVGAGMMPRGLPTRRGLQALALVIATAYATILLYQAVVPRQVIGAIVIVVIPVVGEADSATLAPAKSREIFDVRFYQCID